MIRSGGLSHASIAPLRGILQGGGTPRGFSGRAFLVEESIHAFHKEGCDAVHCGIGCLDAGPAGAAPGTRSEEHTSELQSLRHLVCRLLLEKINVVNEARKACALGEHLAAEADDEGA